MNQLSPTLTSGAIAGFDNYEDRHFYIRAWCVQKLRELFKVQDELAATAPLPPLRPEENQRGHPLLQRSPHQYEPPIYRITQAMESSYWKHGAHPALQRAAVMWPELAKMREPPVQPMQWERCYTARELVAAVHSPEAALAWLDAYASDPGVQLRPCDVSGGARHMDPVDCLLFVPIAQVLDTADGLQQESLLHVPCAAATMTAEEYVERCVESEGEDEGEGEGEDEGEGEGEAAGEDQDGSNGESNGEGGDR